ncbi:MAG: hypothetical protein V3R67_06085 [Thermodesulfobacteriota bacterium]
MPSKLLTVIFFISLSLILPVKLHAFSPEYHIEIIEESLGFLKPEVIEVLSKQQCLLDNILSFQYVGRNKWHFNDCDFTGATENIELQYQIIKEKRKTRNSADSGAEEFGKLLHTVHDFYAHSNWVETIKDGLINEQIIVDSKSSWTTLKPWEIINEQYIPLQGEGQGFDIDTDNRIIKVIDKEQTYPGIITGIVGVDRYCPEEIELKHWGKVLFDSVVFLPLDWLVDNEDGINKDKPGRAGFDMANELAIKQTKTEWCRLISMLDPIEKEKIYNDWVEDKQKAVELCSNLKD